MLRIVSLNLNGIRSATTKGVWDWVAGEAPHVLCVQELKAQQADLDATMRAPAAMGGLDGHFHFAQKKGYSGVGLYACGAPLKVITGFGVPEFDDEGRYVEADFGQFTVISLYLPSGSSAPERQEAKFRFLDAFVTHLARSAASGREIVICGDWNIAHREIDLRNWKGNLKNSGFLPEERAWMTALFGEGGWVDVYRTLHPDATDECYTWWSNRGQARAKNVGWRIDYQVATPGIAARARAARVYKDVRFSDHAPLIVDYDVDPGPVGR